MNTPQEKFWSSSFGEKYIERNPQTIKAMDKLYVDLLGVSASGLYREFLSKLKLRKVLETGCNIGMQLEILQKLGFKNLYGIDIFGKAVEKSKARTKNINIIQGSIFDIPFKDSYFDLVFSSTVLIHISPKDIKKALTEIHRVSGKYIFGYEYFNDKYTEINYRKNKNRLWKGNFAKIYLDLFPNLELVKERRIKNLPDDNIDTVYLLKKKI